MSRVETRTPGVTDVQLPDLFGSGVRVGAASSLGDEGVDEKYTDTSLLPRFRPSRDGALHPACLISNYMVVWLVTVGVDSLSRPGVLGSRERLSATNDG